MDSDPETRLKGQTKRLCRQKGDENEGLEQFDRISNLPSHVITYMLSFLETKEAVRTSILSSRWRYLWKGITRLYLRRTRYELHKFANFVDHVLLNCTATNLEEFNLYFPRSIDFSCLNGWICAAQTRNIEKLMLCVDTPYLQIPKKPLPQCILTCTTLVALELMSCFDIEIPDSVSCFPCLKSLNLCFLSPDHDDVICRLLSCSPVLEEVHLDCYLDCQKMRTLDISIPTLKRLTLSIRDLKKVYNTINNYNVIINTPNLEYLFVYDDSSCHYVLNNLCRVRDVHVNCHAIFVKDLLPEHIDRLFGLLKGIAATALLTLHSFTLDVLQSSLSYNWPLFPFLTYLILYPSAFSSWTCLSSLHSAPNLEVLVLDLAGMNGIIDRAKHCCWTQPECVPSCLLQCIKKIGIKCFGGTEDELQAVEYLLNNARVLNLMIIGFHPHPMNEKIAEKLLAFPRASKTCDVRVYPYFYFETEISASQNRISLYGGIQSDC